MRNYKINISFWTDEPITGDELDGLAVACFAQVEDPADYMRINKRARFETKNVEVETSSAMGYLELRFGKEPDQN